jgi:hypothetical protein
MYISVRGNGISSLSKISNHNLEEFRKCRVFFAFYFIIYYDTFRSMRFPCLSVTFGRSGVFSGTPVSSTNKTDRHDITKKLFKVALNILSLTIIYAISVLLDKQPITSLHQQCCIVLLLFVLLYFLTLMGVKCN